MRQTGNQINIRNALKASLSWRYLVIRILFVAVLYFFYLRIIHSLGLANSGDQSVALSEDRHLQAEPGAPDPIRQFIIQQSYLRCLNDTSNILPTRIGTGNGYGSLFDTETLGFHETSAVITQKEIRWTDNLSGQGEVSFCALRTTERQPGQWEVRGVSLYFGEDTCFLIHRNYRTVSYEVRVAYSNHFTFERTCPQTVLDNKLRVLDITSLEQPDLNIYIVYSGLAMLSGLIILFTGLIL